MQKQFSSSLLHLMHIIFATAVNHTPTTKTDVVALFSRLLGCVRNGMGPTRGVSRRDAGEWQYMIGEAMDAPFYALSD